VAKILVSLTNGSDAEIVLRNNDYVQRWCEIMLHNKPRAQQVCRSAMSTRSCNLEEIFFRGNQMSKSSAISKVNQSLEWLDQNIHALPYRLTEDYTSDQLNQIHRCFTTGSCTQVTFDADVLTYDQMMLLKEYRPNLNDYAKSPLANMLHTDFIVSNYKLQEYMHHLHTVNAYIHHLENATMSPRARSLVWQHSAASDDEKNKKINDHDKMLKYTTAVSMDWLAKTDDGVTDAIKLDYHIDTDAIESCASFDPQYNVIDLKCILGKDYHTAYIDYDNPLQWDITNNNNTTKGAFTILYSNIFSDVFNDTQWFAQCDMPIEEHIVAPMRIGTIDQKFLDDNKQLFDHTNDDVTIQSVELLQ